MKIHVTSSFNPLPHIDAFWRLCSRRLFENIVTKEEIAPNEQFLLLQQFFQFKSYLIKYVQSCLLRIVIGGKGLKRQISPIYRSHYQVLNIDLQTIIT